MTEAAPAPARKRRARKPGGATSPSAKATPASRSTTAKRGDAGRTGRKGKYNANGQRIDGIWFASAAEAVRYEQLKELKERGQIDRLELQPPFPIRINNVLICTYRADFSYAVVDELGHVLRTVVEDVKGMITDVYALKRKMVAASFTLNFVEIPAKQVKEWAGRIP